MTGREKTVPVHGNSSNHLLSKKQRIMEKSVTVAVMTVISVAAVVKLQKL